MGTYRGHNFSSYRDIQGQVFYSFNAIDIKSSHLSVSPPPPPQNQIKKCMHEHTHTNDKCVKCMRKQESHKGRLIN
jgi:hypothetical protein